MLKKNRKTLILFSIFAISAILTLSNCSQPEKKLIPREVLFGNPTTQKPLISPDGSMLAYLAPVSGVMNVWVKELGAEEAKPVTSDKNRGIYYYAWTYDSENLVYLQDIGGDENWRLYIVNLKTREVRDLTPYDMVQARVIAMEKEYPAKCLVGLNKENLRYHDVYLLDMTTGELELVAKNDGSITSWISDHDLNIRAAVSVNEQGGLDLMVKPDVKDDFKKILTWDYENTLSSGPIYFAGDNTNLYILDSRDVNANRLALLNIKTGEYKPIAEDPVYDISKIWVNPQTYEIQLVGYQKDRLEWQALDESVADDVKIIKAVHHGDFHFYNSDLANNIWLLGFTTDDGSIPYYLYDRRAKKATFLFYHRPELNDYKLASMEPISYEARDGLTIHGYITFPPDTTRKDLPMVLNVHGGPYYRDTWGYDPEAQWLANRGYICLQINYRGSTGYGKEFLNAGNREWGGKMHNDLIDGVNWAIDKGYADPEKVAIYGQSFGGYSALVGATFTPDVFKCAISVVGISNLVTWIKTMPPYWSAAKKMMYKRIGNPETDLEFLKSRSPLFKIDNIKHPILIAHGKNDARVKESESEQFVKAMRKKGIQYEYLVFEDEGHGFTKPENKLKFYAHAERFLAEHLGGKFEPYNQDEK
ncbi:MAG: prolyl oligopeptidase family serine peptidase [candidate division Zixibacteria bacterium]|nr:prolyl oligopeptidase family serine peptidase [candidate division Zixibacteria bacterium]